MHHDGVPIYLLASFLSSGPRSKVAPLQAEDRVRQTGENHHSMSGPTGGHICIKETARARTARAAHTHTHTHTRMHAHFTLPSSSSYSFDPSLRWRAVERDGERETVRETVRERGGEEEELAVSNLVHVILPWQVE